jgi:hypothetical protein
MDTTGNMIHLTPFQPFAQNNVVNVNNEQTRADALSIWHLVKFDGGKYRLYNEHSRTALRDSGNSLITAPDTNQQDSDLWQFAKNGRDMWMQCVSSKKWMALDNQSGTTLTAQDRGNSGVQNKESWVGWQLISVASTERGQLMNLPRFVLASRSSNSNDSQVVSLDAVDPTRSAAPKQYMPDDSVGSPCPLYASFYH